MKRALRWLGLVLMVVILGAGAFVARIVSHMPKSTGARIVVAPAITGVLEDFSYVWVLKTAHGAALVDAGPNPKGPALLAELSREGVKPEEVHAILLTHAHDDHWAAAALFPQAKVYVGPGDAALLRGEVDYLPGLVRALMPANTTQRPTHIVELKGDERLELDGLPVQATHIPGHTSGSLAFQVDDVLFTGDTVMRFGDKLGLGPDFFSKDVDQNKAALQTLLRLDFKRICDGHGGLTEDAKSKLAALVAGK